ncbi:MAG: flagellar basal body P-ring formation chaperone FlgA, partial [Caulobacteraceae bacterium]
VIQPSDLAWTKAVGAPVDAAAGVDGAVGLAARRPLRAGDPVLARDLTRPIVIRTGDSVQVTYAGGGVTLTLQGKAMAQAAAGQTLNVLNTVSKKMIEAVATGPGQAVVGPEAVRLRAAREPSEIAFR